jgi:hypothetical protein
MPAGERRVAAHHHFGRWGEPAQFIVGITRCFYQECGFAEIILGGNRLKHIIREPGFERHDRSRISGEGRTRERVNLSEGDFHDSASSSATMSLCPSVWPSGSG